MSVTCEVRETDGGWVASLSSHFWDEPIGGTMIPREGECPFRDGEYQDSKWLWRLESTDPDNGLWYDSTGEMVNGVAKLDCSTKDLPMGYDWRYRQDGRMWWSSCSRREDLTHWYSVEDAEMLLEHGFVFTRYLATEYHEYENETVFAKETCLMREEVPIGEVFA